MKPWNTKKKNVSGAAAALGLLERLQALIFSSPVLTTKASNCKFRGEKHDGNIVKHSEI